MISLQTDHHQSQFIDYVNRRGGASYAETFLPILAWLEQNAQKREIKAGAIWPSEVADLGKVAFILDGSVEVLHGPLQDQSIGPDASFLHDHSLTAPAVAGLVENTCGLDLAVRLRALTDCRICCVLPEELAAMGQQIPSADRLMRLYLEYSVSHLVRRLEKIEGHFKDFFIARDSTLVPGPYRALQVSWFAFLMNADDDCYWRQTMAEVLPAGINPVTSRYLLVFGHFNDMTTLHVMGQGTTFEYLETARFTFGWHDLNPLTACCPSLYPDNYMAICIGRELYGLPKRFGKTILNTEHRYAGLEVDQKAILRATWTNERPIPSFAIPDLLPPELGAWVAKYLNRMDISVPVYVHQRVPEVGTGDQEDLPLQVNQLIKIPFSTRLPSEFQILESPAVTFLSSDGFPLQGRCEAAFYFQSPLQMDSRELVVDYLEKGLFDGMIGILG